MNRVLKTTIAVGFLLVAVVGAIALVRKRVEQQIMDGPGMVYEPHFDFSMTYLSKVSYYRGGGELGDSYSVELTIQEGEDGYADVELAYHSQASHDARPTDKTVRLSPNVIAGVQEIIDRYHMTDWTDLPKSDVFALDAPSTCFVFEYSDGTRYVLDSDDVWPEDASKAIREILDYLLTCAGITEA